MVNKILTIFIIYSLIVTIQACCDCSEPVEPFFDYKSVKLIFEEVIESDEAFNIIIRPDSTFWLSDNCSKIGQSLLMNSAFACSCDNNGEIEKFKITEIKIIPDSIFSESIPMNSSITSLFEISTYEYASSTGQEYFPLDQMSIYRTFNYPRIDSGIKIRTNNRPVDNKRKYSFRIEIIRDNQTVIEGRISNIMWK
ncbi:hypothetical protein [Fulvivirga lutea]|uniref:DUF5034 domain-containing protein n=1 Tax=Fulvivirga lutea TaxID=2810512 RepID=A0A974ZZD4_9BACT|nr:hypothetical protein [Fulvivirga lutea]QSE96054.1 hypothetical protein JR347_10545 [Fulvivirga lutea]